MLKDLILKNRSCRRFAQKISVERRQLEALVDLARLSASAANLQPLRYYLSNSESDNHKIFSCLTWAGYLKDWPGPQEGERPAAYIVMLADRRVSKKIDCDHGIAGQSITLGACEMGLAACMLTAVDRTRLREALKIDSNYDILMVIALGKCAEEIKIDEVQGDDIRYWRDEEHVHHVPKRALKDLLIN